MFIYFVSFCTFCFGQVFLFCFVFVFVFLFFCFFVFCFLVNLEDRPIYGYFDKANIAFGIFRLAWRSPLSSFDGDIVQLRKRLLPLRDQRLASNSRRFAHSGRIYCDEPKAVLPRLSRNHETPSGVQRRCGKAWSIRLVYDMYDVKAT